MKNETKKGHSFQPALNPGDTAPHFEAESTHGTIRLEDYKGKWLIVLSCPTDFCPTWTNEIQKFAKHFCELGELGCEVIGIGGANMSSPLLWSKAVREEFGVKIWFPVIQDPLHHLKRAFGMIDSEDDTASVKRAIYIIDDNQILRSIIYYDPNAFETCEEIVRLVKLLQNSNACGVVTPDSWRPGDEWILVENKKEFTEVEDKPGMWYF